MRSTALTIALILGGPVGALAASPEYCTKYATRFELQFLLATGIAQMNPYYRDRAYSHCLNADEDPRLDSLGSTAATADPTPEMKKEPAVLLAPADPSSWQAVCAARYKSWDAATGTVVKYHTRRRVPCPVPR